MYPLAPALRAVVGFLVPGIVMNQRVTLIHYTLTVILVVAAKRISGKYSLDRIGC